MNIHKDKKGNYRWYHSKGNSPTTQNTVQGQPINNHQPRVGTKRNAGRRGCTCSDCLASKKPIIEEIEKREFKKEIRDTLGFPE